MNQPDQVGKPSGLKPPLPLPLPAAATAEMLIAATKNAITIAILIRFAIFLSPLCVGIG
jgi:hypothetical protein